MTTSPTVLSELLTMLHQPVLQTMVLAPLGLIALDIVTGIMSAMKHGTFSWKILPAFLGNDLFRYIGATILVFGAYLVAGSDLASIFFGLLGLGPLSVGIVASIRENWQEVVGINSPLFQLAGVEATQLQQMSVRPISPRASNMTSAGTGILPAVQKALANQNMPTQKMPAYIPPSQNPLILKDPAASWMQ